MSRPPATHHVLRIRRRSIAEWCGWLLWLVALVVLAEFAITSFSEHEVQAGTLASVIAVGWLAGGVIVEVLKGMDLRGRDDDMPQTMETLDEP